MTTYLGRESWTSTDASGVTLTGAELVGPAFHWPGTEQSIIGVESQSQVASRLRGYRNFHVTGRGWRDIGYNVAFDQAGRVWMLRSTTWGVNMVGAHCASASNPRANHKYVGCLLILGANEAPSAAMLEAINDWYHTRFLARWFGRTDARGHGQVPGASTTCQGPHVRAALAAGTIPGTQGGSIMSWQEDLNPTDLAADRFPDSYSTRADYALMHILGLAYQATFGTVPPNSWMLTRWAEFAEGGSAEDGYSPRTLWRAGYAWGRRASEEIEDTVIPLLRDIKAGQGEPANQEVLDDIHAELQGARAERQALTDKLDAMIGLLQDHAEGTLDAEAVVQRWREVLGAALLAD